MVATGACADEARAPATVAEDIFAALGEPFPNASDDQLAAFARGAQIARTQISPAQGLGPEFNASACADCHERPVLGGGAARVRNVHLVGRRTADGQDYEALGSDGVQRQYALAPFGDRSPSPAVEDLLVATRSPPAFFGAALLGEISDVEILSREDPVDVDGDGVSGRANALPGTVGRYGLKAQIRNLETLLRGSLFDHLGVTSVPLTDAERAALPRGPEDAAEDPSGVMGSIVSFGAREALLFDEPLFDLDSVDDPEIPAAQLIDLASFLLLLAAPQPDAPSPTIAAGAAAFDDVGCPVCHVPALTGPRGLIPAYSDLLLHDLGAALADGVGQRDAGGAEFRTAPLWGVAATAPYLHDGRADTIEEAITLHGGEAVGAREAYLSLSAAERTEIVAFLRSLGGGAEASPGLLPPDAPLPDQLLFGGPQRALTEIEREQFLRGRASFDRDVPLGAGLGPLFSGDSCRACHRDPVLGGAGPIDVDVIRHGRDEDGVFTAPLAGTLTARLHTASDVRPEVSPLANVFEARQAPPLFGVGRVDQIAEATILSAADPEDLDADGISGRAHVLPDGRVGRFGWKADIATLAEFVREALGAEMGLTVPAALAPTLGDLVDDDGVPDPEIAQSELDELLFFTTELSAPPRTRHAPSVEDAGELVFSTIGCADCHVPALPSPAGPVNLFSDLLLHDVAPPVFLGIAQGDATSREFRTPPLWGLSHTAPYFHDGEAATIDEAIRRHRGEANAARLAYEGLGPPGRAALHAFLESI